MSNTSSKKKQLLNTIAVSLGCSSCTTLKLSSIFNPKPKPGRHSQYSSTTSATSSSPFTAVEKDSAEPYLDFRASMLQMIVENEMYTKEDLRNLLTCFLQLNAPSLHGVIIRAFTDIWNTILFSSTATSTPQLNPNRDAPPPPPRRRRPRRPTRNPNYCTARPPKAYASPNSYQM